MFHVTNMGHTFDPFHSKILEIENNLHKWLFLEMVHITRDKNALNFRSVINNLSPLYHMLIK